MAAKQKITVTRTRTKTRVKRTAAPATKGGRKRCPTCGRYY